MKKCKFATLPFDFTQGKLQAQCKLTQRNYKVEKLATEAPRKNQKLKIKMQNYKAKIKKRFQVINSLKDLIEQGFRYEKDCLSNSN